MDGYSASFDAGNGKHGNHLDRDLEEIRREILKLDLEILDRLHERLELAKKAGERKLVENEDLRDEGREEEVLRILTGHTRHPEMVEEVWELLFELCLSAQKEVVEEVSIDRGESGADEEASDEPEPRALPADLLQAIYLAADKSKPYSGGAFDLFSIDGEVRIDTSHRDGVCLKGPGINNETMQKHNPADELGECSHPGSEIRFHWSGGYGQEVGPGDEVRWPKDPFSDDQLEWVFINHSALFSSILRPGPDCPPACPDAPPLDFLMLLKRFEESGKMDTEYISLVQSGGAVRLKKKHAGTPDEQTVVLGRKKHLGKIGDLIGTDVTATAHGSSFERALRLPQEKVEELIQGVEPSGESEETAPNPDPGTSEYWWMRETKTDDWKVVRVDGQVGRDMCHFTTGRSAALDNLPDSADWEKANRPSSIDVEFTR